VAINRNLADGASDFDPRHGANAGFVPALGVAVAVSAGAGPASGLKMRRDSRGIY
jgi:hypothetical protein